MSVLKKAKTENINDMDIFGKKAKDRITGFEGIIVAKTIYDTGCVHYAIKSQELHDGKPIDAHWFDDVHVELVSDGIEVGQKPRGGPSLISSSRRL